LAGNFIAGFNRHFARTAKYPENLHRPVSETPTELEDTFAW